MDTDIFILCFNANNQKLTKFLQQNKEEFDFSELDECHEIYDPINTNKKVKGKTKIGRSPASVQDSITASRSKSLSFSY